MKQADILKELESVTSLVIASREAIREGRLAEFPGFEARIDSMCTALGQLPQEMARTFRSQLISFIDELDKLTIEMQARHEEMGDELSDLAGRQRATAAYGRTQSGGKS